MREARFDDRSLCRVVICTCKYQVSRPEAPTSAKVGGLGHQPLTPPQGTGAYPGPSGSARGVGQTL